MASDKANKAMDKFNKSRAGSKATGRGGSLLTTKGTTTMCRGKVRDVFKEFSVEVYMCI